MHAAHVRDFIAASLVHLLSLCISIPVAAGLLACRLAAAEACFSRWSSAAALSASAVQQEQLSAAVAQLSAAGVRSAQQLAVQVAGLAGRLDALEAGSAKREHVVLQVMHLLQGQA